LSKPHWQKIFNDFLLTDTLLPKGAPFPPPRGWEGGKHPPTFRKKKARGLKAPGNRSKRIRWRGVAPPRQGGPLPFLLAIIRLRALTPPRRPYERYGFDSRGGARDFADDPRKGVLPR